MRNVTLLLMLLTYCSTYSQNKIISGYVPEFAGQTISIHGYSSFSEVPIGSAVADSLGNIKLAFTPAYRGAAMLRANDINKIVLLINNEDITIDWTNTTEFKTLKINSNENEAFKEGMEIYQSAASKQVALDYLLPLYENEPVKYHFFTVELDSVVTQYKSFTNSLTDKMYAKKYLRWRSFISDMPQTAQKYTSRFPSDSDYFNSIDFSDKDLLCSGLLKDILEGYTQLCESLDPQASPQHLNRGIKHVMQSLTTKPEVLVDVSDFWFRFLEQRNLSVSAAYLATYMLANDKCILDKKQADRFEQYSKMGVGKIAPNIKLPSASNLLKLKNKYKLVLFGASWCPACQAEYPLIVERYSDLKQKYDLEIVYISLDSDKDAFESFYRDAPFTTLFDGKEWETKAAVDYHVFATPTLFLLDKNLKILLKPTSLSHVESWMAEK